MRAKTANDARLESLIRAAADDHRVAGVAADLIDEAGDEETARLAREAPAPVAKAWWFFYANDTHVSPPGAARCSLNMARAEHWARGLGYTFAWEYEAEDFTDHFDDPEDRELASQGQVYYCLLCDSEDGTAAGLRTLASLGGILAPSAEYKRLVEASLALDVMINPPAST